MKIITDEELMAEFKVQKSFINRNARKMGGRGRPRRFIYENVVRFFDEYYNAQLREDAARQAEIKRKAAVLNALPANIIFLSGKSDPGIGEVVGGHILGRGGRRSPSPQPSPSRGEGVKAG